MKTSISDELDLESSVVEIEADELSGSKVRRRHLRDWSTLGHVMGVDDPVEAHTFERQPHPRKGLCEDVIPARDPVDDGEQLRGRVGV